MTKAETYAIKIIDDETVENLGGSNPEDQWMRDSTSTSHSIEGFALVEKAGYRDLEVSFRPEKDKSYFLLYVLYCIGDSFGHDDGKINFIGLYRNREVAERNAARIRQSREDYEKHFNTKDIYTVVLETEDGKMYKESTTWNGYFESLESVNIESVQQI